MEVDGFTSTLTLQLHFDKSLITPKVPAQDKYYSVRVRTHLLGIYCANNSKIYCFFHDETTGTMGPNKVISLLDYLIQRLQNEHGRHDHLIIWSDKAPGKFKECFLFFYLDYIVQPGQFLRVNFKFLLEGHTYSVCDTRFGTIQTLFKKWEIIAIPQHNLSNVEVCWVTLAMVKDFNSFLRLRYVSWNEDIEKQRFEGKKHCMAQFQLRRKRGQ